VQQRIEVTAAMKEQLESAYMEFQEMKEKMERVEMQLSQPAGQILKYEELEEANRILSGEVAHARSRHKELAEDNSRLLQDATEMEAKIRELEFENQKIAKRNEFLEQLNKDLQQMADQNKRMETQMRRLTEIESMLGKISGGSH
jgi:DNA repair exonuclease SbcCD ATPase subunit